MQSALHCIKCQSVAFAHRVSDMFQIKQQPFYCPLTPTLSHHQFYSFSAILILRSVSPLLLLLLILLLLLLLLLLSLLLLLFTVFAKCFNKSTTHQHTSILQSNSLFLSRLVLISSTQRLMEMFWYSFLQKSYFKSYFSSH